ncbi:MAG: glycosyltransferase, partial [Mangrovicoccus sp.]
EHLRQQTLVPAEIGGAEIIIAANACTDGTIAEAEAARAGLEAKGWSLVVLDLSEAGKLNALNTADPLAKGNVRAYLDADVHCSPDLLRQIYEALDVDIPRYASGRLRIAPAKTWVTRHYAKVWTRLPFMKTNVPGAGIFAVNAAGRARWDEFPSIIADDGFVRLKFEPQERVMVEADYSWPLVEGFKRLVKVRRRQDAGVRELEAKFPEIMGNESKPPMRPKDHLELFWGTPLSYLVYISVMITVKLGGKQDFTAWTRGR